MRFVWHWGFRELDLVARVQGRLFGPSRGRLGLLNWGTFWCVLVVVAVALCRLFYVLLVLGISTYRSTALVPAIPEPVV